MQAETYTREQFERMTALDFKCPYCCALIGEQCIGRAYRRYTNGYVHPLRARALKRLQDAAFTFFDAIQKRTCEKCGVAVELGPETDLTGHVVFCMKCFLRELESKRPQGPEDVHDPRGSPAGEQGPGSCEVEATIRPAFSSAV